MIFNALDAAGKFFNFNRRSATLGLLVLDGEVQGAAGLSDI